MELHQGTGLLALRLQKGCVELIEEWLRIQPDYRVWSARGTGNNF